MSVGAAGGASASGAPGGNEAGVPAGGGGVAASGGQAHATAAAALLSGHSSVSHPAASRLHPKGQVEGATRYILCSNQ